MAWPTPPFRPPPKSFARRPSHIRSSQPPTARLTLPSCPNWMNAGLQWTLAEWRSLEIYSKRASGRLACSAAPKSRWRRM